MLMQARLSQMCGHSLPPLSCGKSFATHKLLNVSTVLRAPIWSLHKPPKQGTFCKARRRVRYNDDDEDDEEEEDEELGYNAEISMLESYTQSAQDEVLLVRATVDDQQEEVLVFKGFSSSLSFETSPDPSKSVLPARAIIKSVDRIKGPFNPANVEYIEKDLTWDDFKARLLQSPSQDDL
ncbi:hypothetical protein H6P81_015843 [Aristolochia fimbriata]|uniref:DUF7734 domain-containing protein n=1 Tax=Aristolochia fimbriata TaxID=158543 RepID=A0AAV7E6P6_ARIFI|nr:hypothetical protein H6P81_015843 [Aristolochia fimbriata]